MKEQKEVNREELSLLMRKENALDIITGKKKIETRAMNDYYIKRCFDFTDKENITMIPFKRIRFHNYNNTWHLTVKIKTGGYCYLDEPTIKEFNELYDFHDFDEAATGIDDNTPEEEKSMFIWYEVSEVLGTNIAQFKK